MGAPGGSTLAKLAKQQFSMHSLILPAPFSLDMGHPHFARAFRPPELSVSPLALGESAAGFLALSNNAYFVKTQKTISKNFYDFIDGICKAISCAWTDWCKTAVLKGVQVTGQVAIGGTVTGPKLGPIISLKGPHSTLMLGHYTSAVADAVGDAWAKWEASLTVPMLTWYPTFQAFPGPSAPPTENVPGALSSLMQDPTPLTQPVLARAIAGKILPRVTLGALTSIASGGSLTQFLGPVAPHHGALADGIAYAVDTCFKRWRAATMVTKVYGKGPVPLYAPPAVPTGPVFGDATMLPGGFDTATFDQSAIVDQIIRHEAFEPHVYPDPKNGWNDPTVGIGFNLKEQWIRDAIQSIGVDPTAVRNGTRDLTLDEARQVLDIGINRATTDARTLFRNFDSLPAEKQGVLVNMSYNLGLQRLGGFKNLINAVRFEDWAASAAEMKDSLWYSQTGNRAKELVKVMAENPCG